MAMDCLCSTLQPTCPRLTTTHPNIHPALQASPPMLNTMLHQKLTKHGYGSHYLDGHLSPFRQGAGWRTTHMVTHAGYTRCGA